VKRRLDIRDTRTITIEQAGCTLPTACRELLNRSGSEWCPYK